MPTLRAPGHPDCKVICFGSGYAIFVHGLEQCNSGKGISSAAISQIHNLVGRDGRLSYQVRLIGYRAVTDLIERIRLLPAVAHYGHQFLEIEAKMKKRWYSPRRFLPITVANEAGSLSKFFDEIKREIS